MIYLETTTSRFQKSSVRVGSKNKTVLLDLHLSQWLNPECPAFGSRSKQSLCKINVAAIIQFRPRRRHRWHSAICFNEPCLPVAPLSAGLMACNLLLICKGKTFILYATKLLYTFDPLCVQQAGAVYCYPSPRGKRKYSISYSPWESWLFFCHDFSTL